MGDEAFRCGPSPSETVESWVNLSVSHVVSDLTTVFTSERFCRTRVHFLSGGRIFSRFQRVVCSTQIIQS